MGNKKIKAVTKLKKKKKTGQHRINKTEKRRNYLEYGKGKELQRKQLWNRNETTVKYQNRQRW